MKNKPRLSYSVLNEWSKGYIDQAIAIYLHLDKPESEAIKDGKRLHKEFSEVVKKTGRLPDWAGNFKLINPKSEIKIVVPYNEIFDIGGVFDVLDEPNLYELKTGATDILEYVSSYQLSMYFLIAKLANLDVERAFLIHQDQHIGRCEYFGPIWNGEKQIERANNYLQTLGFEFVDYLKQHGIDRQ